jgi:hypothetical protein
MDGLVVKTFVIDFSSESHKIHSCFFEFLCAISHISFLLLLSSLFRSQPSPFASHSPPNLGQDTEPPSSTKPVGVMGSIMDENIFDAFKLLRGGSYHGLPSADSGVSLGAS